MAGYAGYSMSNNAVAAYNDGLVPASKIGKGIPAQLVKAFVPRAEWHHSSKFYNEVDFYNKDEAYAIFGIAETEEFSFTTSKTPYFSGYPNKYAVKAWADFKAEKKTGKNEYKEIHTNCEVKYLEWSGSRNHPKCEEILLTGATVKIKGVTAYVFNNKNLLVATKRLSTNGFSFDSNEKKEELREMAERNKENFEIC